MGIIQQQSIKGTIYSYIGVIIGFLTTALIFPHILSTEEIGLLKLLVSFSILFAQFGSLGFTNVINRLFPFFRNKEQGHGGFITVALIISLVGFLISVVCLESLKPLIIRNNIDDSALFVEYINYLYPLIFFTLFFTLFDNYIKALFNAVIGLFLKELLQRIFILISILLFFFDVFSFHQFVILYVAALSLPTIILLVILLINGDIHLSLPGNVFNRDMWKEIAMLCFHGMIGGFGSIVVLQLDSIMINRYLGISATGVYATTFFFAAIILIPSRALLKISTTIIAEAWKSNDIEKIKTIYQKSFLTQTIVGVILFIGLWVNIDNIFKIIPPEYAAGKWVIFFIGLKNIIDMATGMNAVIILTSRHYKLFTVFILIFVVILLGMFAILIPAHGLTGAAIAVLVSFSIFTLMRHLFLKFRYNMKAFNYRVLIVLLIGIVSYLAGYVIPLQENFVSDLIIRSIVSGGIYFALIVFLRVSEDINLTLNSIFKTEFFWKK